jgi:hypothetical protein
MPKGKTQKHRKHNSLRKTKRKKRKTQKRKQMKSKNTSPIKNIFYIWLGETTKCGLTSENLKSWREGFPKAKIMILVMEEKISEFKKHFKFLEKNNVKLLSPIDFLHSFLDNEPVKKTVALLERFLPFLMDGEKSLYNESFAYVSGKRDSNFYELVSSSNEYFQRVHTKYLNTSSKIAARFKDLLCFIGCLYKPNTLYLDIDTTYYDFDIGEMPSTTKLYLPAIVLGKDYQTDLFAVLSFDKIDIDELIIDKYIKITADYLDAVPYYYLAFTTDSTLLNGAHSKMGIDYMRLQYDLCSTIILAFTHFFFIENPKPLPSASSNINNSLKIKDFSNKLIRINENMMMYPNIQLLDPRINIYHHMLKQEEAPKRISIYNVGFPEDHIDFFKEEYNKLCEKMTSNINEGHSILEGYTSQLIKSYDSENSIIKNYVDFSEFRHNDYYAEVISIYEFRKFKNNDFLTRILNNIGLPPSDGNVDSTQNTQESVSLPSDAKKKDLIQLKNWICQFLDKGYENGFQELFKIAKISILTYKNIYREEFPVLSICEKIDDDDDKRILCDGGLLEFYKKFNKSYFA